MNLEQRSDMNLAHFYREELRLIEETGRRPETFSYCLMDHLKRHNLIGTQHDNKGRRFIVTEKARRLLEGV